jgi:single-strand DNA-binding protein
MPYMNKCTVMGHLGRDAELRYLPSGKAVANFTLAVSKKWKDERGEQKEKTSWIRVTCFGGWAENAGNMKKGQLCLVNGELTQESYEDKDKNKREKTYVSAFEVYALESPKRDGAPPQPQQQRAQRAPEPVTADAVLDDCPF